MDANAYEHLTVVPDGHTTIHDGAIVWEDGKIIWIGQSNDQWFCEWKQEHPVHDGSGLIAIPGMIDVHIHGAVNHDFINGTQEDITAVSRHIVQDGCTAFQASLTVVSHDETLRLLRSLGQCESVSGGAEYLGIHSEGPFLSPKYKALMIEEYLRNPDLRQCEEMIRAAGGKLHYVTIAPEWPDSCEAIRYFTENGVTCMVGHTAAKVQDVQRAYEAGAKGFTHLYNAMSQHTHRSPGVVTAAFLQKDMMAELICDGFHVDPDVIRVTYEMLGPDRICLITDAMLGKGMPDGDYTFSALHCRKVGKTVTVVETGRISGSCVGMNDVTKRMMNFTGCSYENIVQMACVNPAEMAQVQNRKGTLTVGKDADVVLMSSNWDVMVTVVNGKEVYRMGGVQ